MFTIFHLLQFVGSVAGLIAGISYGGRFGIPGAVLGGVLGFVIGTLAGRLPWVMAWTAMQRDLTRATAQELRKRVRREYYISHLLLAELASRGESLEGLRGVVVDQLNSSSADVRRFGEANAAAWFPDLVQAG